MTISQFLRELEEALEIDSDTLEVSQNLSDLESWDSMSALIFMALADEKLEVAVNGNQIAQCETVGDLLALLGDKVAA